MRFLKTAMTGFIALASIAMACCSAYAEAPYCHFVFYTRPAAAGGTEWCKRCVAGQQYSATNWTTCPMRQGPEGPGWARCEEERWGYGSTRVDQLCDYAGGPAASAGGVIRVTSATLGANCGAPAGNVTAKVGAICNGKDLCTLPGRDVNNPDPAQGCPKTFAVEWQCTGGGARSNAAPATPDETTPVTLSCRAGGSAGGTAGGPAGGPAGANPNCVSLLGVPMAGCNTGGNTSGTGRAAAGSTGSSSISGYTGPTTSGTGRATAGSGAALNTAVVPNTGAIIGNQSEERDRTGRLTREAARVYILNCPTGIHRGWQVYIYQYLNRPGFRAIFTGDWSHPVGGRDWNTYYDAFGAACPQ
jgi:hypothetical protein